MPKVVSLRMHEHPIECRSTCCRIARDRSAVREPQAPSQLISTGMSPPGFPPIPGSWRRAHLVDRATLHELGPRNFPLVFRNEDEVEAAYCAHQLHQHISPRLSVLSTRPVWSIAALAENESQWNGPVYSPLSSG
jgi:hypothetical protein